jgi:hypothetical protein
MPIILWHFARKGNLVTRLRESPRPVAIGLGLLLSLLGGRVVEGVLYGVSGRDPIAIFAAVVVLLAASTAAVVLPARRAAGVNPGHELRSRNR